MSGSTKQNSSVPSSCSSAGVVSTVASKVAFPQELRGFNPGPYLPSPFREAYENPDGLLRSGIEGAPPATITSSKAELWQLFGDGMRLEGCSWPQNPKFRQALPVICFAC